MIDFLTFFGDQLDGDQIMLPFLLDEGIMSLKQADHQNQLAMIKKQLGTGEAWMCLKWSSFPETGVAPRLWGFCFEKQHESIAFPTTANLLRSTDTTLTVAWQFGTQRCCFSPQLGLTFNGLGFFWIGFGRGNSYCLWKLLPKTIIAGCVNAQIDPKKSLHRYAPMHHTGMCSNWLRCLRCHCWHCSTALHRSGGSKTVPPDPFAAKTPWHGEVHPLFPWRGMVYGWFMDGLWMVYGWFIHPF